MYRGLNIDEAYGTDESDLEEQVSDVTQIFERRRRKQLENRKIDEHFSLENLPNLKAKILPDTEACQKIEQEAIREGQKTFHARKKAVQALPAEEESRQRVQNPQPRKLSFLNI